MEYCVEIRVDKYDYDQHWMWAKNKEIFEWLFKNVGSPNLGFVPRKMSPGIGILATKERILCLHTGSDDLVTL